MQSGAKRAAEAMECRQAALVQRLSTLLSDYQQALPTGQRGAVNARALVDAQAHLETLLEALRLERPQLVTDYWAWLWSVMEPLGLERSDVAVGQQLLRQTVLSMLPFDLADVLERYLAACSAGLHDGLDATCSYLDPEAPYFTVARRYLQFLLDADRTQASDLIMQQVRSGVKVREVYLHVFQPVQYEIGRLWQVNRISVAHEHFATAVTQNIMAQLYPFIFSSKRSRLKLVATSVSGELHELGVRMVTDLFELEGWDTQYLGASCPTDSVVELVKEQQCDVLALGTTLSAHLGTTRQLIESVRHAVGDQTKVLVGGYAFKADNNLWRELGADGYAEDADGAVELARSLLQAS